MERESTTMGSHWKLLCVATGLWTAAAVLAVGGTVRQELFVVVWALLVGLAACMATGGFIAVWAASEAVRTERLQLERLAEIMAQAAADPGVSRLPR